MDWGASESTSFMLPCNVEMEQAEVGMNNEVVCKTENFLVCPIPRHNSAQNYTIQLAITALSQRGLAVKNI